MYRILEVADVSERQKRKFNNVQTLENDYVRSTDHKTQHSKKQKVRIRRRIVVCGLLPLLILLVILVSATISQNKRLAEKEQLREDAEVKLAEVKEQQEMLKLQITKLEDDEYIAKLARKEYFLSDDGEIIFTIPGEGEKDKKSDKNTN